MSEGFSFDDDDSYNRFTFENVGADNVSNRLTFQAENWTEALEKFIQFLRGSGYFIDYNSIAINADRHRILPESLIPTFYPDYCCNEDCCDASNGAACDGLPEIDTGILDDKDKS